MRRTLQYSSFTLLQICLHFNLCYGTHNLPLDENLEKILISHKSLQNYEELGEATTAYSISRKLLDEGKGIKALEYVFKANQFYVPESLIVMWDIAHGKYPSVPKDVQQEFLKNLPDIKTFESLYKSYQVMFSKNHLNIIKDNNESSIRKVFKNFSYNLGYFVSHSFKEKTKDQSYSIQQQEIDIPLLFSKNHLKKDL